MRFDPRGRLDTSQVRDRRGAPGVAVGAGGLGIVGVLVVLLISVLGGGGGGEGGLPAGLDDLAGQVLGGQTAAPVDNRGLEERCTTGADAEASQECLIVAVVNSVQDYWTSAFASGYRPAATTFFSGGVSTRCGNATSAVGPFYCPADEGVYIDLGFFDELESRFGASGGDFAQAYVIAHEYGHHVQNLVGTSAQVQASGDREGPESGSVRLELQADCFAGVWANNATTVPDPSTGRPLVVELTDEDIAEALSAAAAVGDDRIQEQVTGRVDPESWTHGSAEQRQRWFRVGFETGDPNACDTFSADPL
jgi:predicted metalloprotease